MTPDFAQAGQWPPPTAAGIGRSPLDAQRADINLLTSAFLARVMAAQRSAFHSAMEQARTRGPSDVIDLPFLGPGFGIAYSSDYVAWQFPAGRHGAMFLLYSADYWLYAEFLNGLPSKAILDAESNHAPLDPAEFHTLRGDVHRRLGGYLAYYRIPSTADQ